MISARIEFKLLEREYDKYSNELDLLEERYNKNELTDQEKYDMQTIINAIALIREKMRDIVKKSDSIGKRWIPFTSNNTIFNNDLKYNEITEKINDPSKRKTFLGFTLPIDLKKKAGKIEKNQRAVLNNSFHSKTMKKITEEAIKFTDIQLQYGNKNIGFVSDVFGKKRELQNRMKAASEITDDELYDNVLPNNDVIVEEALNPALAGVVLDDDSLDRNIIPQSDDYDKLNNLKKRYHKARDFFEKNPLNFDKKTIDDGKTLLDKIRNVLEKADKEFQDTSYVAEEKLKFLNLNLGFFERVYLSHNDRDELISEVPVETEIDETHMEIENLKARYIHMFNSIHLLNAYDRERVLIVGRLYDLYPKLYSSGDITSSKDIDNIKDDLDNIEKEILSVPLMSKSIYMGKVHSPLDSETASLKIEKLKQEYSIFADAKSSFLNNPKNTLLKTRFDSLTRMIFIADLILADGGMISEDSASYIKHELVHFELNSYIIDKSVESPNNKIVVEETPSLPVVEEREQVQSVPAPEPVVSVIEPSLPEVAPVAPVIEETPSVPVIVQREQVQSVPDVELGASIQALEARERLLDAREAEQAKRAEAARKKLNKEKRDFAKQMELARESFQQQIDAANASLAAREEAFKQQMTLLQEQMRMMKVSASAYQVPADEEPNEGRGR